MSKWKMVTVCSHTQHAHNLGVGGAGEAEGGERSWVLAWDLQ